MYVIPSRRRTPLDPDQVRDDKGRRRLHGAFTGGFSAGYFNTVGSKEGTLPYADSVRRLTRSRRMDSLYVRFFKKRPQQSKASQTGRLYG
jgi:hypothetical protein